MVAVGDPWGGNNITMYCEATVNGERFQSSIDIWEGVYADDTARANIEEAIRAQLMLKILERYKPAVKIRDNRPVW